MSDVWPVLLGAVLAPALFGAGLVTLGGLSPAAGRRVFAAWSYLVGQFALAWLTFAWLAAGKPVAGWWLPAAAAAAGLAAWWWGRARTAPARRARSDRVIAAVTAGLVVLLLERASAASLHAILLGDEANIWSAKARLLWTSDFGTWLAADYARHADYPMFDPLVQTLAFASAGQELFWENRLPMLGFAIALVLLLADVLERLLPRGLAVVLLLAFATSAFLAYAPTAMADVLLAFGLFAASDALRRWQATGEPVWWRLACVGGAAMLATKNEGAMLLVAVVVAGGVARLVAREPVLRPLRQAWGWLALPAATFAAGAWFNAHYALANDLTSATPDGRGLLARIAHWWPERTLPVLQYYAGLFADGAATRWLLPAMLLAPLAAGRRAFAAARAWPWFTVVVAIAGYMAVFVGTTADQGGPDGPARGLQWHLATAADRTLLHVLPLAVMALALQLARSAPATSSADA